MLIIVCFSFRLNIPNHAIKCFSRSKMYAWNRKFKLCSTSMIKTFKHILKPKLVLWIVLSALIIWTYAFYSMTAYSNVLNEHHLFVLNNSGYLIKTSGCRIPEMYVKGPEIDKYMNYNDKLDCESTWNYTLPLVSSNLTSLIVNVTAWLTLNLTKGDPAFKCYYTPIERPEFDNDQDDDLYDDNSVKLGESVYFVDDVTVPDEMVEVTCTVHESTVYKEHHVFARPAPATAALGDGDVSVMIVGLDAVSRLNFRRQMPETAALLSRLHDVEMMGYNKVEDNTFPNVVPLLSGLSADQLRAACWPRNDAYFDACRFVWHDFAAAGYATAFAEDSPAIGAFNYLKPGFRRPPTDHYLRPVMLRAERELGHGSPGNTACCTGRRLAMAALLDHALKLSLSMAGRRYMGFVWSTSLTHDYVEYPRFGDRDLAAFFRALRASGQLDRTVVLLMSDHGIRWGEFRDTYQGGLEDRLPICRVLTPRWFRRRYRAATANLALNAGRLTTPYDVHETLLQLADAPRRLSDDAIASAGRDANARGVSLFLDVPENRTCDRAGVPVHYCGCHDVRVALPADDADVQRAAVALVRHVNTMLLPVRRLCAALAVHRVHEATVETGRGRGSSRDYEIRVTTVPGHAKLEAVIREYHGGRFTMVGTVSRLNLYGNQSACVDDAALRLVCYCVRDGKRSRGGP